MEDTTPISRPNHLTLFTLPSETHLKIFRSFPPSSHIGGHLALGLTCRKFYNILKGEFPSPIRLIPRQRYYTLDDATGEPVTAFQYDHRPLVTQFLHPDHRPLNLEVRNMFAGFFPHTVFVSRDAYGDVGGEKDRELVDRWECFRRFERFGRCFLRPYGVDAEVWYEHAFAVLRRWEVSSFQVREVTLMARREGWIVLDESGRDGVHLFILRISLPIFERYWRHFERFWDEFEEWREMIGF